MIKINKFEETKRVSEKQQNNTFILFCEGT